MKKLVCTLVLGLVVLGSCEYPIRDINNWWRYDVLKQEDDSGTVQIELEWEQLPVGDEEENE